MKKNCISKKLCAWILAAGMVVTSLSGISMADTQTVFGATNHAPSKPTDLKTEMLREAYGIDTKNPAFSWVVNDKDANEVQTAYRIVVSKTSELKGDIYDTDWVASSESSFVHISALKDILDDNQLYYWQVQTKDAKGAASPMSDAAPFMTDIASEWQSLNGIWASTDSASDLWTDYSIEQTVVINDRSDGVGALAILMRVNSGKTGYMLQLRDDNTINCHYINNGNIDTSNIITLKMSDYGVTIPTNQSAFKVKLTAEGSVIAIGMDMNVTDGVDNYVSAGTLNLSQFSVASSVATAGMFGYRTGNYESGTVDDIKVTDMDGNVLYSTDFSTSENTFNDCSVSGGKLSVGKGVFSVYSSPNTLTPLGNFSFIRSPKLTITDTSKVDKAIISAACRGTGTDRASIFDLFFNGESIGAGSARELKGVGSFGGTSNFRKVYYNSYDVTEFLANGNANVISAVGNSRDQARSILIQMTIFYKDGTKEILTNSSVNNSGWKTLEGTKAFDDQGSLIEAENNYMKILHDNYNAEFYPMDWYAVNYDDSAWADAKVSFQLADAKYGKPNNGNAVLYPYSAENVLRRVANEPAKSVYRNTSGNLVVDLGKEIVGGLKVNIDSASTQTVTVRRGEEIEDNGTVKYQLSASPIYEDKWKLKEGMNSFETYTMRNFRYVEFVGMDDATEETIIENPDAIMGWAMEQAFDESVSAFEATDGSDAATLLNRLYDLSKYTIQATNQDVYTDSQARERAPYEGDLLVNSNTSYSVLDQYALARHSNEWLIDNPTWPNDYSLFSVEMAYWDYIYTGNTDSIEEYYNALKLKLTTKIEVQDTATGLIRPKGSQAGNTALIDWPTSERDGYTNGHYDVILNSEYVGIYNCMAQISEALGEDEDAEMYRRKSDTLKEALITYAYDEANGCFYDALNQDLTPIKHSSTHASAYALTYGVFEDQDMADRLCEFVYNKCKDEFKGSVYFTYFILKGLYNGNHGDYAESLITNPKVGENVKTFASLLDDLNCTITPEAWGHKWKRNMTLSHPWGAAPGCSIVQGMFGITPTKAGFEEFTIKLQPGEIASAIVKAPTVKGTVSVEYMNGGKEDLAENKLVTLLTIPANSKAVVYLPVPDKTQDYLWVDKEKVDAVYEAGFLKVTLGSGMHAVSVLENNPYADRLPVDDSDGNLIVNPQPTPNKATVCLNAASIPLQMKKSTSVLKADGLIEGDSIVSWTSSNPSIATVNSANGKIKAKKVGTTVITVTTKMGATATCTIKVQKKAVKTKKLTILNGKKLTLKAKKSVTLQVQKTPLTATDKIKYTSSKSSVVKVNGKGKLTAKKKGKATITVKSANGKKAKIKVTVK